MERLTSIFKQERQRQVTQWCRQASWAVVAVGLLFAILGVYNALQASFSPVSLALSALAIVPSTIFYFCVLQAAGVILDRLFSEQENNPRQ